MCDKSSITSSLLKPHKTCILSKLRSKPKCPINLFGVQEREPILYLIVLLNNGIIHSLISWQPNFLLEVVWTVINLDLGLWDLNNNNDPWSFTMIQCIGWILTLIEDFKFVDLSKLTTSNQSLAELFIITWCRVWPLHKLYVCTNSLIFQYK